MAHWHRKLTLLVFGAFVIISLALAPSTARGMRLLTPDTGWVRHRNTLYWTADGGGQWSDITPVPPGVVRGSVSLESVFFLDTQQGWAVISYREGIVPSTAETLRIEGRVYAVAHTVTSGQTWSFTPLSYPELPKWIEDTFAGPAGFFFLDSQHGWLDLGFAGNSRPGKLLATQDGGRTWNWVKSPGVSGEIVFASKQDGWLVGGPYAKLYTTHDGCESWQEVQFEAPPQVRAAIYFGFEAPPFLEDGLRGYVAVQYVGRAGSPSKLVVYSTVDAGRTWKASKVVNLAKQSAATPFTIADSTLVVSTQSNAKEFRVSAIPLSGEVSSSVVVATRWVPSLSFADAAHGLAIHQGRLLSTKDGGATWTDVTPWSVLEPAAPKKRSR